MKNIVLFLVLSLWLAGLVSAQETTEQPPHQAFVQRDIDSAGQDRLIFVDTTTGDQTPLSVTGERYTIIDGGVLFLDTSVNRVKVAKPDGTVTDYPFIQPTFSTRRVDWVVSDDGKQIAWTLTDGSANALTTTTTVANLDGSSAREVLVDGPREGIRAMPVALAPDGVTLYMDYQPDVIGSLTPFQQYAGLFSVDVATGNVQALPDEPGCFCGAGIGSGYAVRLAVNAALSGFDVRVTNLASGSAVTIPSLNLVGFTQAGDVLIAPDGTRAVYALAQVQNFGATNQSVRTVFVVVDLITHTQRALTDPITTFVHPVAWTEDNSAILFTSPSLDGTWKVSLSDGRLVKVASATYVGRVH